MAKKKIDVITCPHCGKEYLPAEIYLPDNFFGRPEEIERDGLGKVKTFYGTTLNTNETYTCDCCDTTFCVKATVKFESFIDPKKTFSTEYVSPLKEKKISLFEGK